MVNLTRIRARLSFIEKYRFQLILIVALSWTTIDLVYWYLVMPQQVMADAVNFSGNAVLLRCVIIFIMSCIVSYILLFKLRQVFRNYPLLLNLLIKSGIMLSASLVMNFLLQLANSMLILDMSLSATFHYIFGEDMSIAWLLRHSVGWILLFVLTQIVIEINEKYSPGVFWAIMLGRYIQPKVQKRIVMFIDLKDSTPIAEKLGSKENFKFIRDFIYYVSVALMEYDGRIYQYVGDEIVVSWMYSHKNVHKALDALVLAIKLLERNGNYFHFRYGVLPEFKVGIHAGEVTVGEIGIVKKDLAMSGDTMNTAARIRASCNDLNYKYLVSKEFLNGTEVSWQTEDLGPIDLKGKNEGIELVAIKV